MCLLCPTDGCASIWKGAASNVSADMSTRGVHIAAYVNICVYGKRSHSLGINTLTYLSVPQNIPVNLDLRALFNLSEYRAAHRYSKQSECLYICLVAVCSWGGWAIGAVSE